MAVHRMKTEENEVADLTQEAGLEDANDSELFANLTSRAPTSGLHRRPQKALAEVARLGALVSSVAPGRSVPPPPSAPGTHPLPPGAPVGSAPPWLSSAAPAAAPIASGGFDEEDALTPARQTLPVPHRFLSPNAKLAIAVGAAALALFVVVAGVARSLRSGPGSLLVTVTGPGSSEVGALEVLVDGENRCAASPCRIASIGTGTHLVSVRAKGFNATAALATTVSADNESVLNVTLSPVAAPSPAAPIATPAAPAKPADQVVATAKPQPIPPAPAVRLGAAPAGAAPTVAPPRGNPPSASPAGAAANSAAGGDKEAFGTLRIVSLPVASILVDGRPIGNTPQVVRVSPGQHRVAIVAGEDRRAQTVTVAPGATQVVSVRF
jgi:hypothetical protein